MLYSCNKYLKYIGNGQALAKENQSGRFTWVKTILFVTGSSTQVWKTIRGRGHQGPSDHLVSLHYYGLGALSYSFLKDC